MAACFMTPDPKDASIYVTGLQVNNSCLNARTPPTNNQILACRSTDGGRVSERHQKEDNGVPAERYVPTLAVTRRSLPISTKHAVTETPHVHATASETFTSASVGPKHELRKRPSQFDWVQTIVKPVLPARGTFQSRSQPGTALSFLAKSKVDLRTGFMRTLSRPTPGELDLNHHRHFQERGTSEKREVEQRLPDPDRLRMTDVMRMLKSKSANKKLVIDSAGTTGGDDAVLNHGETRRSAPCDRQGVLISCEPSAGSGASKRRSKEHKLRLQALYSHYHHPHRHHRYQCEGANGRESSTQEFVKQGRTSKDHDRTIAEKISRPVMLAQDRMRSNNLSSYSFVDDDLIDLYGEDSFSETQSVNSSSESKLGDMPVVPLGSTVTNDRLAGQTCHKVGRGHRDHSSRMAKSRPDATNRTLTSRQSRVRQEIRPTKIGSTCTDIIPTSVPSNYQRTSFSEFVSIVQPMRPPANSPVSMAADGEHEDDATNTNGQWADSYQTKSATPADTGREFGFDTFDRTKGKINIFLPQMT